MFSENYRTSNQFDDHLVFKLILVSGKYLSDCSPFYYFFFSLSLFRGVFFVRVHFLLHFVKLLENYKTEERYENHLIIKKTMVSFAVVFLHVFYHFFVLFVQEIICVGGGRSNGVLNLINSDL